ncbi:recombinase family protein [Streptomyces sp. NBC_01455]|uniref:recombinase family protein n=1 Tax=Streptomyces sp. NBC_01455 TaxID=2903874 RepID=UPI002E3660E0|nr:recombinase family protein [Streptomyces sp. NBC_01455]
MRQSTLLQVRENTESTARQYGLADRARELGWAESDIGVVDADLGTSGRFSGLRAGFQQLVARVRLGEVGAVFGLEVSRLARSSAEFGRLLEFARLTDTLLIDADGVYDLGDFNDRLVLGLKSTMARPSCTSWPDACTAPARPPPHAVTCGCRCPSAWSMPTTAPSSWTPTKRCGRRSRMSSHCSTSTVPPWGWSARSPNAASRAATPGCGTAGWAGDASPTAGPPPC